MAGARALRSRSVPSFVPALNGLIQRLLRLGIPMGPNALLTVRGRLTGKAHTFPVAILRLGDRRFVQGTFGETNWVLNLRSAGEAAVTAGHRVETVDAVELSPADAAVVLRDALAPFVSRAYTRPLVGRFFELPANADLDDYLELARQHPTFELRPRRAATASLAATTIVATRSSTRTRDVRGE